MTCCFFAFKSFVIVYKIIFDLFLSIIIKNINYLFVACKQCNIEVFFDYLHVPLDYLFVKLLGINLTPLVYDAIFLLAHDKDVQQRKFFTSTILSNIK